MSLIHLPMLCDRWLTPVEVLHPDSGNATINLSPLSTASITLPDGERILNLREIVQMYSISGEIGYFRVSAVSTTLDGKQKVNLEHAIVTMEDYITAKKHKMTGSAKQLLTQIIGCQTGFVYWAVGDIEKPDTETIQLEVDYTNCMEAIVNVGKLCPQYYFDFEMTNVLPWKLHLRKKPTQYSCECRAARNVRDVTIKLDDTELVTRVIHPRLPGGAMNASEQMVHRYGYVCTHLDADDEADPTAVYNRAVEYLEKASKPRMTLTCKALWMAEQTGEPLDSFTVGRMCRVALPDYGHLYDQLIVSLKYDNLYSNPESITLQLSNVPDTVEARICAIQKKTGGGGGGGKKKNPNEVDKDDVIERLNNSTEETVDEQSAKNPKKINGSKVNLASNTDFKQIQEKVNNGSFSTVNATAVRTGSLYINNRAYTTAPLLDGNGNTYYVLIRN